MNQINQILKLFEEMSCVFGMFSATIHPGESTSLFSLLTDNLLVVEEVITNFLKDPVKIMVGGKNNVLSTIDQSLKYCGTEYGKLISIKELINVI